MAFLHQHSDDPRRLFVCILVYSLPPSFEGLQYASISFKTQKKEVNGTRYFISYTFLKTNLRMVASFTSAARLRTRGHARDLPQELSPPLSPVDCVSRSNFIGRSRGFIPLVQDSGGRFKTPRIEVGGVGGGGR